MARRLTRRCALDLAVGAAGITVVTAVIWGLRGVVPASALGGLYVLAILPVAIGCGFVPALAAAVVSALAFDFFFFPPYFSFALQNPQDAVIVVISGVIAAVVSVLAGRVRERAREAEALAREQAGLRRVATLVARGAPPGEVFAAVAAEAGQLVGCDFTLLNQYDPDGEATVVGAWSANARPVPFPVGGRAPVDGRNVTTLVFQTGEPARIDNYGADAGPASAALSAAGIRSAVGSPIIVEDRLWGVMVAAARDEPLPVETEARLAGFTELVATAIANAESKAQLIVSRARIVATADATRHRIERDLHDGAQQRLISLALQLRVAQAAVPPEAGELAARLDSLVTEATSTLDELRELARGIHPVVLAEGGLAAALEVLARRSAVPVELDVRVVGRSPEQIEVAAYYLIAEALTNAAKHAHASVVHVEVDAVEVDEGDGVLRVHVRDDGRGGANPAGGSGLVGLKDRIEALGGRLWLQSTPGAGTTVQATLPLHDPSRPGLLPEGAAAPDAAGRTRPAAPS